MIDPLSQFKISKIIPIQIFGLDISFTNASLAMIISCALICLVLHAATKSLAIIPNRMQASLEIGFHAIGDIVRTYVGPKGWPYFPYIFSLFLFILGGNLLGMFPLSFTFTSHIIVTFTLACSVFIAVTIVGFYKHGIGFLKLFFPSDVPLYVAPLLVPVEIISYLSRPVSLSVRLFANMVAGHVMLKIFACFSCIIIASSIKPLVILPILMGVAINGFEVLVAFLQDYVFTILTCIYLNDALNLH
jgi:F-type H+-transporting ATPase subunit a